MWRWFFDNAPKLSALTALIYLAVFVGSYVDPSISQYEDGARFWLLVGVVLFIPLLVIDVIYTHNFESGEVAWVGLLNSVALGLAYWKANTAQMEASIKTAILIFIGLIVLMIFAKMAEKKEAYEEFKKWYERQYKK